MSDTYKHKEIGRYKNGIDEDPKPRALATFDRHNMDADLQRYDKAIKKSKSHINSACADITDNDNAIKRMKHKSK